MGGRAGIGVLARRSSGTSQHPLVRHFDAILADKPDWSSRRVAGTDRILPLPPHGMNRDRVHAERQVWDSDREGNKRLTALRCVELVIEAAQASADA